MRRYRELGLALLLQALGAGAALLIAAQTWQRLTSAREGPFPDVRVSMTGRDVDSAVTALALVALAGVVAVLATGGRWRRAVGVVVALAGAATIVRAVLASGPVGNGRALRFITDHRQTVTTAPDAKVGVDVVAVWPVLTVGCGVLVLVAGLLIAVRGGRWQGMSTRYERRPDVAVVEPAPADTVTDSVADSVADTPEAAAEREGRAATAMWSALDRGDDPTA